MYLYFLNLQSIPALYCKKSDQCQDEAKHSEIGGLMIY